MNSHFPALFSAFPLIVVILVVWTLVWKGIALWRAARNSSPVWFVVLLIVNTLGILEIIYILAFSKQNPPVAEMEQTATPAEPEKAPEPQPEGLAPKTPETAEEKPTEETQALDEQKPNA